MLLLERLVHASPRSRRRAGHRGVFIDLDLFKAVNDTHGHDIGDELLVAVARRLAALLRPADTLARLSGDEYVALCEDLDRPRPGRRDRGQADGGAEPPFPLTGVECPSPRASVSPTPIRATMLPPKQLLHDADMGCTRPNTGWGASAAVHPGNSVSPTGL